MTDQNSFPDPNYSQPPSPQPNQNSSQRWVPGVILILLGGVFLLGNLTHFTLDNWWALFILIPAVGSFSRAYEHYRQAGRLDEHAVQALLGGAILTAVTAILLFQLSWALFGPAILILIGLSLLGREWLRK